MTRRVKFTNLAFDRSLNIFLNIAARRVIRSGIYLNGVETRSFEMEFVNTFFSHMNGIAVGNGFDALQIILKAYGIGPGKSVIVPTLSPLPVWMAVTAVGAQIIPADPSPTRWVLTANSLPMRDYVDAIIAVHLFGMPSPIPDIGIKAKRMYGKKPIIIEDCCQADGTMFDGMYAGSFGDAAAFSFYPTKNLGGLGDGGMIVTGNDDIASRCREIAAYGGGVTEGVNSRMDEIQAAFLRVKLRYLDRWNKIRDRNATRYFQRLIGFRHIIHLPEPALHHSWHQFVITTRYRDALMSYLRENGVETFVHYWAHAPNYKFYNVPTNLSIYMSNASLSLPIAPHVTLKDVDYICDLITKFATGAKDREKDKGYIQDSQGLTKPPT